MKITFIGAVQTVTGSKYLLESNGKKILLDCGLFQGSHDNYLKNWESFSFDAKKINAVGFDKKTANPATIHNELILDDKYVLVGRGIYALSDWGYKPGVVAEVISEILKEAGEPLSREEIIEQVARKRMVKRSTIILALMNKNRFKKVAGGYTLNQ